MTTNLRELPSITYKSILLSPEQVKTVREWMIDNVALNIEGDLIKKPDFITPDKIRKFAAYDVDTTYVGRNGLYDMIHEFDLAECDAQDMLTVLDEITEAMKKYPSKYSY